MLPFVAKCWLHLPLTEAQAQATQAALRRTCNYSIIYVRVILHGFISAGGGRLLADLPPFTNAPHICIDCVIVVIALLRCIARALRHDTMQGADKQIPIAGFGAALLLIRFDSR
jgi:hypothetical protein